MHVESRAWRTDLALLTYSGSLVEDRGDHLVVRTPANPAYYWGNFLLLPADAVPGDLGAWVARFEAEFPGSRHCALGVDGRSGTVQDLAPLRDAGFRVEASSVMTADSVVPPARPTTEADVRALTGDDDWAQQVTLSLVGEEAEVTSDFVTARVAAERSLVDAGHGQWFGAFLDGQLVSSLGIFVASPGLARYQQVKTHPEFRGRGLCGTLVHHAGRFGFDELGVETLVMVADPDYSAIRIYRAAGFRDDEIQLQATRTPA